MNVLAHPRTASAPSHLHEPLQHTRISTSRAGAAGALALVLGSGSGSGSANAPIARPSTHISAAVLGRVDCMVCKTAVKLALRVQGVVAQRRAPCH